MEDKQRFNGPLHARKPVLGKRGLMYKYPVTFNIIGTFTLLSIFFSKPLYDAFFREKYPIEFDLPFVKRLREDEEKLRQHLNLKQKEN